jgi:peptide chain release factor 3
MLINPKVLASETARRRAFAIISHPDAGKTTLTEKLLLYGGAIQLAGSVKARRSQRKATSDWMEMEKQRGISVTSTVLQFEYQGYVLNLLDTPGHNDFSADTYRTLTAADSAVMLVDNAKGVEAQTKKLFAVCRQRGIPIFTFVNKMDHEGLGPLNLLSEIEEALGIRSVPMNWPIGDGSEFRGVYDRATAMVHIYERTARGATKAGLEVVAFSDPQLPAILGQAAYDKLCEDIDLIDIAAEPFNEERVAKGELTPVFFGSALTNFGVEPFLQRFIGMAPPPTPRFAGDTLVTTDASFSGFVFKIQANMNPEHRDRIAFLRVVSGVFEKDMEAIHVQSGKTMKISRPQRLFAQDRETVESAFPGDVIGIPNPGTLRLGDTLRELPGPGFDEVPVFAPETFAALRNLDTSKFKQFEKGVQQLVQEGLVELFEEPSSLQKEYILGAVGQLQFDVVLFRLASEYGIKAEIGPLPQNLIVWVEGSDQPLRDGYLGSGMKLLKDRDGQTVLLASSEFGLKFLIKKHPEIRFLASPGGALYSAED